MDFHLTIASSPQWHTLALELMLLGRFVIEQGGRILEVSSLEWCGGEWVSTMSYCGCPADALVEYAKSRGAEHLLSIRA